MAEMDVDSPQSSKLFPIIWKDLPMSFLYDNDEYYVRDCYPEYYGHVLKLLTHQDRKYKKWYVSVTGTPGIGKSIFYIYFFHRYREEHPNATIVTASFRKENSTLEMCVVYKPGAQQGEPHKEIPYIKGAFHLYDGPPECKPYMNQMVCFTSPNKSWFDDIRKERYHARLYMPLWTLEELFDANDLLDEQYGLDEDLIRERFQYVGGVPRLCLELDQDVYNSEQHGIEDEIKEITSFSKVKTILYRKKKIDNSCHRIFHYSPVKDETGLPRIFTIDFCSPIVSVDVDKAIIDRSEEKRKMLVVTLRGSSEAASLLGWLFEVRAKEIFTAGDVFSLRNLSETLTGVLTKFLNLEKHDYIHAIKAKQQSFDGYFWDHSTQSLYLFQITRSLKHPVNAHGIVELLKDLQRQGNEVGKSKVFLVFVVPKDLTNFKKQTINPIFTPGTINAGLGSPVTAIKGIGTFHAQKLAKHDIYLVQDLQNAMEVKPDLKKSYQGLVQAFTDMMQEVPDWNFVSNIPQYLLVLDEGY